MVFLFLGPSGSGKDTQAKKYADKHWLQVISTGEAIRQLIVVGDPTAKRAEEDMKQGNWIADEIVFYSLRKYLQEHKPQGFVLTGAVRKPRQVKLLDEVLAEYATKLDLVVHFELSDQKAVERLAGRMYCPVDGSIYNVNVTSQRPQHGTVCDKCSTSLMIRNDDRPEAIRHRLQQYHENNRKILEIYEAREILLRVDADREITEIAAELESELTKLKRE